DGRDVPALLCLQHMRGQPHTDRARRPVARHLLGLLGGDRCCNRRRGAGTSWRARASGPGAGAAWPTGSTSTGPTWSTRSARSPGWSATATSTPRPAHRHTLHGHLEHRACARRFDPVFTFAQVFTGHGPAVAPQQRGVIQHTDCATTDARPVIQRELHQALVFEQPIVTGADEAST